MIPFATPVSSHELPSRFPSPFDRAAVHPLAQNAVRELLETLRSPDAAEWALDTAGNGKMFGVLVVQDASGQLGYLRAFSGMLGGVWDIPGWAPPSFDASARDAIWLDGDAEMRALAAERDSLVQQLSGVHNDETLRAFDATRSARSRELLPLIQATYRLANALGEVRTLHEIFAPAAPPAGAGDCAAPKLLAQAYREGLRPIALGEVWWGAPPRSGDRRAGSLYPACHGKCGPILAHMLHGLPADPPPRFGAGFIAAEHPVTIYEDAQIVIVNKPCGLLSVPGRGAQMQDSVSTRLRARYPEATGQLVVHRLDLDTSGLMLAARDTTTFSALQRLFSLRQITKRYVAWLDGEVAGDEGLIDLPIRMDVDDRPRQIHDAVHGKAAVTGWRVLERASGRTKVAFTPYTGRTHQLRVHSAHPQGLDAPIIGDRLYGRAAPADGERLLLHAELLAFVHPVTGQPIRIEQQAPFL